jgi:hypothetical protein
MGTYLLCIVAGFILGFLFNERVVMAPMPQTKEKFCHPLCQCKNMENPRCLKDEL